MIVKEWVVNNRKEGFQAIGFVANRNIRKGAELTINYGYDYNPETSQRCLCRTSKCNGWIGWMLLMKTIKTSLRLDVNSGTGSF